jgi:hypothetical protein
MQTRRRKFVLATIGCMLVLVLGFALCVYGMYRTTEMAACECKNPVDKMRFEAMNPFRDRQPERVANQVIEALQQGRCKSIEAALPHCGSEARFKIKSWSLTGRESSKDWIEFRFWVIRTDADQTFGDPVWVAVQRDKTSWRVTNVDMYY